MRSTSSNQAKSVNPNIGGEQAVIAKVGLILNRTLVMVSSRPTISRSY